MQPWRIGDMMSSSSTKLITLKRLTPYALVLSSGEDMILDIPLSRNGQIGFSLSREHPSQIDHGKLTRLLERCAGIALTGFQKMASNKGSIPQDWWNDLTGELANLKLTLTNDRADTLSFKLVFVQTSCAGTSKGK